MIDGDHVIADHSFDHMSHNSENSPKFAYRNVEEDVVSKMMKYVISQFVYVSKFLKVRVKKNETTSLLPSSKNITRSQKNEKIRSK